jgi:hypothetical protein
MIFNRFTNINEMQQPPLTSNHLRKKVVTYGIGNPNPGLEQVLTCGGFKTVDGIPTIQR